MRQSIQFALALGAVVLGGGLGGCQEGGVSASAPRNVSAPGVPIAVESIAGAPDTVTTNFSSALASEASARQVELVGGSDKARYRVRGYLSAQPTDDGSTALAFVWDVFDAQKKRAQRVQGASVARAKAGSDPWAGVDQTVVAKAASESMDAIAGFLSTSTSSAAPSPASGADKRGTKLSLAR